MLEEPIPRLKEARSAKDFEAKAKVPIQICQNDGIVGYSKINVQDFAYECEAIASLLTKTDVIWCYGKWKKLPVPGWHGFIERITSNLKNYSKSQITFLPFINQPASNYNTIYTTLLCALENAKCNGYKVCIVTFDQHLYAKAREIVPAAPENSEKKIIIRLGGFHLLMSFLGAIGYIMQGSGMKEVLSKIYAPKSLEKMLNGVAYARAVRAHTLLQLTLGKIILDELNIGDVMNADLIVNVENLLDNTISYNDIESYNQLSGALLDQFKQKLKEFGERGPTAKLWVQYFNMVTIPKEFIRAERMGDWKAHLSCVKEMVPYFYASGHFPYAKSAHLYLQDMQELENSIDPTVYQNFTEGFFIVRRSDKLSCGTSTDMIIEQSMMKAMKTDSRWHCSRKKYERKCYKQMGLQYACYEHCL